MKQPKMTTQRSTSTVKEGRSEAACELSPQLPITSEEAMILQWWRRWGDMVQRIQPPFGTPASNLIRRPGSSPNYHSSKRVTSDESQFDRIYLFLFHHQGWIIVNCTKGAALRNRKKIKIVQQNKAKTNPSIYAGTFWLEVDYTASPHSGTEQGKETLPSMQVCSD